MKSLLIKNGQVYHNGKLEKLNVLITDGKIKALLDHYVTVDKSIDTDGKLVLPGIIDPHVHCREPGLTHKEDFESVSRAAAAGGITTILDMPNSVPPTINEESLKEKKDLAKEKCFVHYGFHLGATLDNYKEIGKIKKIASVKVFLDESTGNFAINDEVILKRIFKSAKLISVHAENENILKAIELIKETKNKLYICHISSEKELEYAKKKRIKNKWFIEVTPHHLFLTDEDVKKMPEFLSVKPSIKTKKDQDSLWDAIKKGIIDTIGSDHAPHTKEEKSSGVCYFGVPGIETMLPLMLDAVNKKRLTLQKLVELMSENPAKIFNLKNKGMIKEDYDADLIIVDMNLEKEIRNEDLHTKCGWSPYNGWKLKGFPIITIVGGEIIYNDGKINDIKAKGVRYR